MKNNKGLTNIYINKFLSKLNTPYFKGIYAVDKCPDIKQFLDDFCLIINTATIAEPGEHWIVIMRHKNQLKFSDSLNLPILFTSNHLKKLLKKAKPTRTYAIQAIETQTCGFYCIHDILLFHLKSFKIKTKIKKFKNTALYMNDEICISNIEKMIPLINKYDIQ